jgi:hypothetical protein
MYGFTSDAEAGPRTLYEFDEGVPDDGGVADGLRLLNESLGHIVVMASHGSGSRFARMPTLATIKPSRRWGTEFQLTMSQLRRTRTLAVPAISSLEEARGF